MSTSETQRTDGYGDTPEDVQRRIDEYVQTNHKRPVAVSVDGGSLLFGFLEIEMEEDEVGFGENLIRQWGRYTWTVSVEAPPRPNPVQLAIGADVNSQPLTGTGTQRGWTAETNERMWTIYLGVSELHGLIDRMLAGGL